MRLVTFERAGETGTGVLLPGDRLLDVSSLAPSPVALAASPDAAAAARAAVATPDPARVHAVTDVRLLAPVPRPGAIWCIGYNYRGHTAVEDPPFPDVFVKTSNTVVGPDEPVILPRASVEVDYEAELAVVIGTTAHDVTPERALEHVAGYTVFDDVSARDWQRRTSQWVLGKSFDTFGPMGPALVTVDEVPDPQDLTVQLRCNGELTVSSHTSRMVFPVAFLVSYLSQVATLQPGDVIATGTPQKLPDALEHQRALRDGDECAITIGHLGTLTHTFRTAPGATTTYENDEGEH